MDTVYALFQTVVEAHKSEPAIIENNRTMTFGELSNMVDMIACSFPREIDGHPALLEAYEVGKKL